MRHIISVIAFFAHFKYFKSISIYFFSFSHLPLKLLVFFFWLSLLNERKFIRLLTLFLHVTCTLYFVSGHNDNSTSDVSVKRLPIRPPPSTSHVTRQFIGGICLGHVISVVTRYPWRTIEITFNGHSSYTMWLTSFVSGFDVHWFQHCKKIKLFRN